MIVIGAQAVYLHTGGVDVAIAEATKDSDVALDTRILGNDPKVDAAMKAANFILNPDTGQPGSWVSPDGIPVDLMVPEMLAGAGSRSVEMPPHDKMTARRAVGLEATVIDYSEMPVPSLDTFDRRVVTAKVAGPTALLVAKCHKIGERAANENPSRLVNKDAHDVYRILRKFPTEVLANKFTELLTDELAGTVSADALDYLQSLFGDGPEATGSVMAGRAEEGVGEPDEVSVSVSFLAADLVNAIRPSS
ncbi:MULTISPECIES: hypothetical protein [Nocardiaceae]|uniref:rRNA maturation protein Nop10 n=1 Tax=Rhodococcoides corynebacterioides TaxID=53972 RepID=A0ABS2KRF4_9NOCA|nr:MULTISPECIES: hypothetical protein [Rhodococcus]MBM7414200.1 rRNA maturation protein Nop10 [Rhodococcus corynebacterioides]MBP1116663.1 rRNA maturation protein Nop10 [Rhodococcus sp. PvP016]